RANRPGRGLRRACAGACGRREGASFAGLRSRGLRVRWREKDSSVRFLLAFALHCRGGFTPPASRFRCLPVNFRSGGLQAGTLAPFLSLAGAVAQATLARGFVQDKRSGDGGVQGVYRLRKLDANERVGAAFDFGREAGAFVADENRDGLAKIEFVGVARAGIFWRRSGDDLQARDAKLRKRDGRGEFAESRKTQSGTGGGSERFRGIGMRGAFCGDDSRGAEGFSGAEDRADVAGILHADENYD